MATKRIGELNGLWGFLFKTGLILLPITVGTLMTWGIWMTSHQFKDNSFRDLGPRYTKEIAEIDQKLLQEQLIRSFQTGLSELNMDAARSRQTLSANIVQQQLEVAALKQRIAQLESGQVATAAQIVSINEKLDRLLIVTTELKTVLSGQKEQPSQ